MEGRKASKKDSAASLSLCCFPALHIKNRPRVAAGPVREIPVFLAQDSGRLP